MVTDKDGALWVGAHEHLSFRGSIKKWYNGVWQTHQLAPMGYESAFPYAIGITQDRSVVVMLTGTAVKAAIRLAGTSWEELNLPTGAYGPRAMAIQGNRVWIGDMALSKLGETDARVIPLPNRATGILSIAIDTKEISG